MAFSSCCKTDNSPAEALQLDEQLQADEDCTSLLKKHMTHERLESLRFKKTKFGGTLADCIRSGCENTDSGVGIYACDPDAYTTFADIFDAIIKDYHRVDTLKHPEPDFGDLDNLNLGDLDPGGKMIVSTRIRVGRSHNKFTFPPTLKKDQRLKMEKMSEKALSTLTGELKGTYHSLETMDKEIQKQLIQDHLLYNDSDRFLRAAGGYNHWPSGRGIFYNTDKTFVVWVNEEDHLRLISMQPGGNLGEVYTRLVKGIKAIESSGLNFAKKKELGYLTFCPSNLGTALRASVHIKIPRLSRSPNFKLFCNRLNIQARGIHGEHTESVGGVYDISNRRRLGLTEYQVIQEMKAGVEAVMAEERVLADGVANTKEGVFTDPQVATK